MLRIKFLFTAQHMHIDTATHTQHTCISYLFSYLHTHTDVHILLAAAADFDYAHKLTQAAEQCREQHSQQSLTNHNK